jgi:hypothetical protein
MAEPLRGVLERADRLGVAGWAHRDGEPVTLEVFVGRRAVAVVRSDEYRADLLAERDGACAFEAWFPEPLATDRNFEVRVCTPDGRNIPGSPRVVSQPHLSPGERLADTGPPLALVVDEAVPDGARDAGSVALLSHIAALRRLGLAPLFVPLAHANEAMARLAGRVRLAWLHRLRPMLLLEPELRARNPGVRVVWSVADLAHLRAQRRAALFGRVAPHGLEAAEHAAARAADAVVTHSPVEAALLERLHPRPRAHWVPWSVPPRPVEVAFAQRAGIAFLGSYGHAPNLDAARVLLERVMPLVWRMAPIPCVLAGTGAPPWLRQRAAAAPEGLVRLLDGLADTATLWRQVRVSAAPLRFGAGVKGKVLDSLAAGIPCVCSPMAAEGLDLPPMLRVPDIPAMAAALLRLHAEEPANAAAAASGFAMLAARHTDAVVDRALSWALAPH